MNKRYISILTTILVATAAIAQTNMGDTINHMVLVESTYNPIITNAVKRNFIPGEVEPSVKKEAIVYANEGMPITMFERKALPVAKIPMRHEESRPGYVHFGYGTCNNLDGYATYNLQFKEKHSLSFDAGITGWNTDLITSDDEQWNSHLYNAMADIRYRLALDKHELGATISTNNNWFNYLTTPYYNTHLNITDLQRSNRHKGDVYVRGEFKERFSYDARATYTRASQQALHGVGQQHSEGHMLTEATIKADLNRYGKVGINLRNDLLNYSSDSEFNDVHYMSITPQWSSQYAHLHYAAGLNIDIPSLPNSSAALSPQCYISYNPEKRFNVALKLDGGRQLPTYSYLETISPYWTRDAELQSSYTQLNACLSSNIRLTEGLHLHLHGGYRITQDALFETTTEKDYICYTGFANRDAQLAYANSRLSYDYKQRFTCFAEGTYSHWMVKGDRAILARAPQLEAKAGMRLHIIKGLTASSDIRYVMFTQTENQPRETSIIDWSLNLQYALTNQWAFFVDGHNLLNRHYEFYTGYPSQGINAMVGTVFKF